MFIARHILKRAYNKTICSLSVPGPTAWNSLPVYVKNAPAIKAFKLPLKSDLVRNYVTAIHIVCEPMHRALRPQSSDSAIKNCPAATINYYYFLP